MNIASTAAITVLVVVFILYRQTREQPLKDNLFKLPLIIGIIGVFETAQYLGGGHHVTVGATVAVLVGFVVAAILAVPRAHSMQVYRNPAGVMVRKGGALTIVLWVVAIAAHVAISLVVPAFFGDGIQHGMGGLDGASIMIYLAISLGAQAVVTSGKVAEHHRTHSAATR